MPLEKRKIVMKAFVTSQYMYTVYLPGCFHDRALRVTSKI